MVAAMEIVEDNGIIICASECCDGIGNENFVKLLSEMKSPDEFIKMIMQPGYFHDIQWGIQPLVHILKKARIFLVSSLSEQQARLCWTIPFHDINQAIEKAIETYGKNTEIAVIPDGPYTLVKLVGEK
jgi:nickel-dependent lactate racemase